MAERLSEGADKLADWLGEMPEARNVFDHTDEATTVITIDVETLARRLDVEIHNSVAAALAAVDPGESLAVRLAPIEALAEEWERTADVYEREGMLPWVVWRERARDLRAALAASRPVHPAGDEADEWTCEGCDRTVTDLGGDEMLGWATDDRGYWYCPGCVADSEPAGDAGDAGGLG